MDNYNYPGNFDIGVFPRLRNLNIELLSLFRQIGREIDQLSYNREQCENFSGSGPMVDHYRQKVKSSQAGLRRSIGVASLLLAEIASMGGKYHIPNVLKRWIKPKEYHVKAGALAHLPGANFYFAEDWDAFPNFSMNHKDVLRRMSSDVNRITFLQECGKVYRESTEYRGFYLSLKAGYEDLHESNFEMNALPALMDKVRQILSQEPKQLRKERMKKRREKMKKEREEKEELKRKKQYKHLKQRQEAAIFAQKFAQKSGYSYRSCYDLFVPSSSSSSDEVKEIIDVPSDSDEEGQGYEDDEEGQGYEDVEGWGYEEGYEDGQGYEEFYEEGQGYEDLEGQGYEEGYEDGQGYEEGYEEGQGYGVEVQGSEDDEEGPPAEVQQGQHIRFVYPEDEEGGQGSEVEGQGSEVDEEGTPAEVQYEQHIRFVYSDDED